MNERLRSAFARMVRIIFTSPSRYAYERRLRGLLGGAVPRRPARVLDIGCGDGRYAPLFEGSSYTGIDIGAYDLSRMRSPGRSFCRASAETPPFVDGTFDLVFSSFMIEHVRDPRATLSRFRDLLSPGGTLFMSTGTRCASLTGEMHRLFWRECGASYGQAHHYFDGGELERLLGEAGFASVTMRHVGGPLALVIEAAGTFFRYLAMKARGLRYTHARDSSDTPEARRERSRFGKALWRAVVPPLFIVRIVLHEGSYWIDRLLSPLRCSKFVVFTASAPGSPGPAVPAPGEV